MGPVLASASAESNGRYARSLGREEQEPFTFGPCGQGARRTLWHTRLAAARRRNPRVEPAYAGEGKGSGEPPTQWREVGLGLVLVFFCLQSYMGRSYLLSPNANHWRWPVVMILIYDI